jgi:hypothetical protein
MRAAVFLVPILGLSLALSAEARARPSIDLFTDEGNAELARVIARLEQGALGSVKRVEVAVVSDRAFRLDLIGADEVHRTFVLHRPPVPLIGAAPRQFLVFAKDLQAGRDIDRLGALLDKTFAAPPWKGDFPAPLEGPEKGPPPVGRLRAYAGVLFLGLSLAAAIAHLLFETGSSQARGFARQFEIGRSVSAPNSSPKPPSLGKRRGLEGTHWIFRFPLSFRECR